MPTGYTSFINDGTVTDMKGFAKICARAFGALISLRDEPLKKDLPKNLNPDFTYHEGAIAEAEKSLTALRNMSYEDLTAAAEKQTQELIASYEARLAEKRAIRSRYEKVLAETKAWEPGPTYADLKKFMIHQIEESIDHDCSEEYMSKPVAHTADTYLATQAESLEWKIKYHRKQINDLGTRTDEANAWLDGLKKALGE